MSAGACPQSTSRIPSVQPPQPDGLDREVKPETLSSRNQTVTYSSLILGKTVEHACYAIASPRKVVRVFKPLNTASTAS